MCPICPKCKKKIDCLEEVDSGTQRMEIFFNKKKGYMDYRDEEEFKSDGEVRLFYCPECYAELDFNDEEAEKFLRNNDELKELVADKIDKIKKEVKNNGR